MLYINKEVCLGNEGDDMTFILKNTIDSSANEWSLEKAQAKFLECSKTGTSDAWLPHEEWTLIQLYFAH